jgi:glycosyltransferase involved in cell wall biosynthesis
MYGARLPEGPYAQGYLSQEEAERLGIWMLIDVLRNCRRLFVHSGLAQEIARLEASAVGLGTPVLRVPFGFPEPGLSRPKKPGRRPLLVSFGLVDPVKRSHVLVQALAKIRRRHPRATLLFAGPVAPSEARRLRDLATEFRVGDAVACTGELSRERYHDLLGRADMAIQLRAVAQGEASASVAEAMANGLPTVVSRRGWMSELPDDVVLATDPECGPAELASVVSDLLDDEERFAGLAIRGQEYARAHSFDVAAEGLLSHLLQ